MHRLTKEFHRNKEDFFYGKERITVRGQSEKGVQNR